MNRQDLELVAFIESVTCRQYKLIVESANKISDEISLEVFLTHVPDLRLTVRQYKELKKVLGKPETLGSRDNVILLCDSEYPVLLKEISDPPKAIYFKGNKELLSSKKISIVGTRKTTVYGKGESERIVDACSIWGVTTVSGLAYGIDSYIHNFSLKRRVPTIAVLPTGIENIAPRGNIRLAEKILSSGGLLLSEYESLNKYSKFAFPRRNRVIAGLSGATVVIEAPAKSGSLITARSARDNNREVFACVGDPGRGNLAGNFLLFDEDIASPITQTYSSLKSCLDIFSSVEEQVNMSHTSNLPKSLQKKLPKIQRQILESIRDGNRDVGSIQASISKKLAGDINAELAKLQLCGLISKDMFGNYECISNSRIAL